MIFVSLYDHERDLHVTAALRPSGLVGNHVHLHNAEVVSSIVVKTRICILVSVAEKA